MKAFFPIVGEKEYKDSILRTKRRQFVFTKLNVETVFISFVSFSFNKRHVSVPTRTSIRAIGAIRVKKKYSCHLRYSCSKKTCVQNPCEIRVPNKYSCHSNYSCSKTVSATLRTKIRE